jgi:protein transport protein SEC13
MTLVFDTAHADMVHDAQLDYYGKRLATCSSDRAIKIFDVLGDSHQHVADLVGHQGPVWQVRYRYHDFVRCRCVARIPEAILPALGA